ncbi:uncharacterized protein Tco025E_00554 [Trypanosoma conorhini]|uniref:CH-like domain-containing protein n=1 Tax=Trypanosoma conorhini TaxID=83891 RepID=A0A3R7M5Y0_9TRYP|nr:uncharacterized protein Tco025E_00554 [Trypanosoma conorhini]RNF27180.1 hypothetical protein Tco025E_00554 [Trypanosoma conorhini]
MTSLPELRRQPPREGMPREVVAWIRTLHLPRVVRHPKRDLSNGFLVAVICSRYWSSVSMHSYEDRMSAAQKRSNWEMLQKQFALNKCPLSERMIEGMMAGREDYANSFLRQLYTQLTGRAIVEAAPLPAAEVAQPKTLLPQSAPPVTSTKINVEFAAPAVDSRTTSTTRVRELRSSNVAALASSEHPPPVAAAKKQVIHAIAEDQQSSDAGDEAAASDLESAASNDGAAKKKRNWKPPMDFSVSLRPAELRQTVVRPKPRDKRQPTPRDEQKRQQQQQQQQQQPDDAPSPNNEATALDFIEYIVRTQAADQGWMCARDSPAPFTDYFLREESKLGALLPRRLWSALLGSVSELTDRVLRQGGSMADIAALFLRSLPPEETGEGLGRQSSQHSLQPGDGSPAPRLWKKKAPPRGNSGPQRFVFLAAMLSSLSDADTFLAISVYCDDVLSRSAEAMRTLDHATADSYASLLCAALPANRRLAARLLPDVLVAVHSAVAASTRVEARISYCLFLRALLLRLARTVFRGSSRSTKSSSFATNTLSATASDPLAAAAFEAIVPNVLAALSHESSTVRLVGVHLAEALAFTGCPPARSLGDILPLLSAGVKFASPLFNCVGAAWLRTAMKCLSDPYDDHAPPDAEGGAIEKDELCAQAAPHLAAMVQHFSDLLMAPGRLNAKTYVAEQLALCLDDIPSEGKLQSFFNPEKVARSVFSVLQGAPAELVAGFLTPPSSTEGGGRVKGAHSGQVALVPVSSSLLGTLRVDSSLRDCYPLALSEAVLLVFPPEAVRRRSSARPGRNVSGQAAGAEGTPMTPQQILAKATLLLRDRVVPADVAQRVTWMYKVVVACRSGFGFPERPASLSEAAATKRWIAVMRQMYRDVAVLVAAAEMLCTQKGALTDDAANAIAKLAGMAQQIVLRWHVELKKEGALLLKSPTAALPTSSERMTGAMAWYHNSFAELAPKESPPPQQQQSHRPSRHFSASSSRPAERKR